MWNYTQSHECQISLFDAVLHRISSYTGLSEPYLWGPLNVHHIMDGWSSNNDSYHFGVERTSIMLRKRWTYASVHNACWFKYHSLRDHIWKHNLLRLWCPSYNNKYVKGTGKVPNMFTLLHIKHVIRGCIFGKYQCHIRTRQSFLLHLGFSVISILFNTIVLKEVK